MKVIQSVSLIIISAVLYALSFIVRPLWWTILLFTFPLAYIRFNFFNGFFWGLCAFSMHASGILYAAMRMQNGPWIFRVIPSIAIALYLAIHAGIWFFLVNKIKRFKLPALIYISIISLVHTFFFWHISYYCFWPLIDLNGYPFLNPLLPLTQSSACLLCIRYTGMLSSLFVLFFANTLIVSLSNKSLITLYAVSIFCLHLPLPMTERLPDWAKLIAPFQVQFSSTKNGTVPLEYLEHFIHQQPHKKIFITPESAFYCHEVFNDNAIPALAIPDIICILGTFTHIQSHRYNSLYYIKNGTIRNTHHKQHAVLTEALPHWCAIDWVERLHDKRTFITPASRKHDAWVINDHLIEPYICSEFFCHPVPFHPLHKKSTILLCCNDSWFTDWSRYGSHLMVADARLKAAVWGTDVIYIGYQDALFICKSGDTSAL